MKTNQLVVKLVKANETCTYTGKKNRARLANTAVENITAQWGNFIKLWKFDRDAVGCL